MERPIIDVDYEEVVDEPEKQDHKEIEKKKDTSRLEMLKSYLTFAALLFVFLAVSLWICEIFGL